jgi:hypothetical protein
MKPLEIPAFIPAGLLGMTQGEVPTAHALMIGRLLEGEKVTNRLTGCGFYRVLMETPAGPVVLIVEPDLLEEMPEAGSVLQAGAWISGRLAPENDEK